MKGMQLVEFSSGNKSLGKENVSPHQGDTTETVDVGDSASGFQDCEKHEPFFTYLDHLLK